MWYVYVIIKVGAVTVSLGIDLGVTVRARFRERQFVEARASEKFL